MSEVIEIKPRRAHPNQVPFQGVLCLVDTPSDKAPSGANGHRVQLTRAAAEEALWSLVDMGIDFKPGFDGHDAKQKIGVIKEAWLEGEELHVSGFLYARDFKHLLKELHDPDRPMGMSYELADAHVADMRQRIWSLTKVTFTGAAILYCDKAAYGNGTRFNIAASREVFDGKLSFVDSCDTTGSIAPQERRKKARP